ncbi:hypothetical protein EYF80_007881 [Liparis tanakae]|uniref:Uncharacterized protein n=1 Tax=Liparis tanakae TaxID=230148 RepID=A0A4Z2IWU2_9TELE|nr:hypothetical protein EYF80_007881 [Liparis tanakae]
MPLNRTHLVWDCSTVAFCMYFPLEKTSSTAVMLMKTSCTTLNTKLSSGMEHTSLAFRKDVHFFCRVRWPPRSPCGREGHRRTEGSRQQVQPAAEGCCGCADGARRVPTLQTRATRGISSLPKNSYSTDTSIGERDGQRDLNARLSRRLPEDGGSGEGE